MTILNIDAIYASYSSTGDPFGHLGVGVTSSSACKSKFWQLGPKGGYASLRYQFISSNIGLYAMAAILQWKRLLTCVRMSRTIMRTDS